MLLLSQWHLSAALMTSLLGTTLLSAEVMGGHGVPCDAYPVDQPCLVEDPGLVEDPCQTPLATPPVVPEVQTFPFLVPAEVEPIKPSSPSDTDLDDALQSLTEPLELSEPFTATQPDFDLSRRTSDQLRRRGSQQFSLCRYAECVGGSATGHTKRQLLLQLGG